MITGSGLKDIASARKAAQAEAEGPYTIGASLEELERALRKLGLAP
jgi:hypothetical protein